MCLLFQIANRKSKIANSYSSPFNISFSLSMKPFRCGITILIFGLGEFAEQLLLFLGQLLRDLDQDLHEFVAVAVGAKIRQALPFSLKTSPCCVPGGMSNLSAP